MFAAIRAELASYRSLMDQLTDVLYLHGAGGLPPDATTYVSTRDLLAAVRSHPSNTHLRDRISGILELRHTQPYAGDVRAWQTFRAGETTPSVKDSLGALRKYLSGQSGEMGDGSRLGDAMREVRFRFWPREVVYHVPAPESRYVTSVARGYAEAARYAGFAARSHATPLPHTSFREFRNAKLKELPPVTKLLKSAVILWEDLAPLHRRIYYGGAVVALTTGIILFAALQD